MPKNLSLLFVCIGNTCRSPIAEGIAKRRWPDRLARSAGIRVQCVGQKAAWQAVDVMRAWNIDLDDHKTTSLDGVNVNDFDYIIAMDPNAIPALREKGVPVDRIRCAFVDDPWNGERSRYEECADKIGRLLEKLDLS